MRLPVVKIGDVVMIEFLDHSEDGYDHALKFTTYGKVLKITKLTITIGAWTYTDPRHAETLKDFSEENEKKYTLVRSTITKLCKLVPKRERKKKKGE